MKQKFIKSHSGRRYLPLLGLPILGLAVALGFTGPAQAATCVRTLTADVVVFDMPLMWNRLGAQNINGMMYALKRDTVNLDTNKPLTTPGGGAVPGRVALRPDKRPRPLVLRLNEGDCLAVTLTNLLTPVANPFNPVERRSDIPFNLNINDQVADRTVGFHSTGMELVNGIDDDSSFTGENNNSLVVGIGASRTYTFLAREEGAYVVNSYGAAFGGQGQGGNTAAGLLGMIAVQPGDAAIYRGQLTREEMDLATIGSSGLDHPVVDYEALYPPEEPWLSEGKAGLPILNMICTAAHVAAGASCIENEIVHSDVNAFVGYGPAGVLAPAPDGPHAGKLGHFPARTYPLESAGKRNPTVPNRLEPFRDFASVFHDEVITRQAFPRWFEDPVFSHTLHGVRDSFMINYVSGGIGTEIISSRLGVGPMHDCVNCAYEEFFLTSGVVGDPGMLVDIPANVGLEECDPALNNCGAVGPKANYALYPDDPGGVHHSYVGDFVKFRNVHAGPAEQHIFHLHNHQWLFNANDDNANYLDAQGIGPGSGYTYEIAFGGSGNRNKSSGDAIFHCHFYPHFAQGMWYLWRNHEVFEQGTKLAVSAGGPRSSFVDDGLGAGNGTPAPGARALPDGEIVAGTPIPAVVPLPGKPMAPMPGTVTVKANPNELCVGPAPAFGVFPTAGCASPNTLRPTGSLADVTRNGVNPGFPFWIAGMEHTVGQRPPTPPLDMLTPAQAGALGGTAPLWNHPGLAGFAADPHGHGGWDGGLPRFTLDGFTAGGEAHAVQTRFDFSKEVLKAKPFFFPEAGTDLEQLQMAFMAKRCHDSFLPDGGEAACSGEDVTGDGFPDQGGFIVNGAPPVPGAPFNEPCIDDKGQLLAGEPGAFFSGESPTAMSVMGKSAFNAETPRVYKGANVQFDAVFNKLGYHFPQERIITLWQDVVPTINQERPPEPFVLRLNTFDCAQYLHTNLVPKAYELDDYQVRTPTDIIGQHIHLPKWDLTSADGSANGWNYEDGTLAPGMTVELIEAINAFNADPNHTAVTTDVEGNPVVASDGHSLTGSGLLEPSAHPFFGTTPLAARWLGARTTIQRWFADPVVNVAGHDRGLGIIFTHDHFGPSTHQQVGLYATVLTEPAGSEWRHNETGQLLYDTANRLDGGPTSWQAAIITPNTAPEGTNVGAETVEDFREFYFEYSDFQHAYEPGVFVGIGPDGLPITPHHIEDPWADGHLPGVIGAASINETFRFALQPSVRDSQVGEGGELNTPDILITVPECPGGLPRPCPEAISADDPGMFVVNYRNESLLNRVFDPNKIGPDGRQGAQADGRAGDLAFAMHSGTQRAIPELNDRLGKAPAGYAGGNCFGGVFCPPINQLGALAGGDPFTPMPRALSGDRVHIKMQVGGHEEEHVSTLHGLKWLQGGSGHGKAGNSGWRNSQTSGISEQFSLRMPVFFDRNARQSFNDYAWSHDASLDGWSQGTWGLLRNYRNQAQDLFVLPDHPDADNFANENQFRGVCPRNAPVREYDVTAVLANDVLPNLGPGVTLTRAGFEPQAGLHAGGPLDPEGGTLVYNARTSGISGVVDGELRVKQGPLHDPTAILYLFTADLIADDDNGDGWSNDLRCLTEPTKGKKWKYTPERPNCPVKLKPGIPVEPLVLRAAAGDCVLVTLRNKVLQQAVSLDGYYVYKADNPVKPVYEDVGIDKQKPMVKDTDGDEVGDTPVTYGDVRFDRMPDLPNRNPTQFTIVRDRNLDNPLEGVTWFGNNHISPSTHVGLHAALLEYDVSRDDGVLVGQNNQDTIVPPGAQHEYRWYAGHLEPVPGRRAGDVDLVGVPIEFGGFNISPADKIKQHQKGLIAGGAVYPEGSSWSLDPGTHASATVTRSDGTVFRDFTQIWQKNVNLYWADGDAVFNSEAEEGGVTEDPEDMGHMAINYGTEPAWFRFGIPPCNEGTCALIGDAHRYYANELVGADPETPVFTATAGVPFRMHLLLPAGAGRKSVPTLHGHVWQRDPYVCPGSSDASLPGKCSTGEVGSRALGDNPVGFGIGAFQSFEPSGHFEIVAPSAGGAFGVPGDYLFRDHMGIGNMDGLWGILRVTGDGNGNNNAN